MHSPEDGPVRRQPHSDVREDGLHAARDVVLEEALAELLGLCVEVLPRGQHEAVGAVPQPAVGPPQGEQDVSVVEAEAEEREEGLAEVEEAVEEDELQVDAGHRVHDQRPDAERDALEQSEYQYE